MLDQIPPLMQNPVSSVEELRERAKRSIDALREGNRNFENAYDSYTMQYGKDVISINESIELAGTIEPAVVIIGRNCVVNYYDSKKALADVTGIRQVALKPGVAYIIGRREPQDSKLVIWNPTDGSEVELTDYNPSASRIPSRIHAAIIVSNEDRVSFSDLSSSGGTTIVGDSIKTGPFVKIFDPGSSKFPMIKIDRTFASRKV